jgi:acyl carrier protein
MDNGDEVLQKLVALIAKRFHPPAATVITPETTAADVLGWDSLSHTLLIMDVEDAFGVELPFDEITALANVGELAALVARLQAT